MMCHAGFGGVDPASGEYYCFLETFAGGYGGRAASDGPGRGADARPEHRERAGRGDRAELPGARRAALARRRLRRAGPVPRRARAAQGLRLRPADDVHRARRPRRCAGRAGAFGGLRRPRRGVRPRSRRRGAAGSARRRRSSSRPATRSATARAAAAATARRGARPRARAARRARGQGAGERAREVYGVANRDAVSDACRHGRHVPTSARHG